jgi:hypothetical protein
MPNVPQPPDDRNPAFPPRRPSPWTDLIAFLGVLCLGGVLIALGHIPAGSLATICAALGGLYAIWRRSRALAVIAGHAPRTVLDFFRTVRGSGEVSMQPIRHRRRMPST